MWFIIFIFAVLGVLSIIKPKAAWFLANWWRFSGEVEASEGSLLIYRLSGFVYLIVGFILLNRHYL